MTRKIQACKSLTHAQICQIATIQNRSLRDIAAMYDVDYELVRRIRNGSSWSRVTGIQYQRTNRKVAHRLTDREVLEIFKASRLKRKELSQRYNVTPGTIAAIQNGASRSDLTGAKHKPTPKKRLTSAQVVEIRASTDTRRELSERYGITEENLSYILNYKTWKQVA